MIVVAASLVTATGAFSSVQAERTAEVNVVGDENAYLGLTGTSPFAEENEQTGELEINFDADHKTDKGGKGVNPRSVTAFDNVFTITNQGTKEVDVTVKGGTEEDISIYDGETGKAIEGKRIIPGESIQVGLEIDASDKTKSDDTFTEEITISANSPNANNTVSLPNASSSNPGTN